MPMDGRSATVFLAGTAVGASALFFGHLVYSRYAGHLRKAFQASGRVENGHVSASRAFDVADFENDEVVAEHLTRIIQFFGPEAQKKIAGSFVVVIGLGVRVEVFSVSSRGSTLGEGGG